MRSWRWPFLILLSLTPVTGSQQNVYSQEPGHRSTERYAAHKHSDPLQLVTRVLDQAFCDEPDPEIVSMRVLLLLCFTNVSNQKIMLERGSKLIPRIMVSKTPGDAGAAKFEHAISADIIPADENPKFSREKPDPDLFVVLLPGASYETTAPVSIPIPRSEPVRAAVSFGQHYLQVVTSTWDGSQKDGERLSKKWVRDGLLWFKPLISEPMLFTVEHSGKLQEDCECRTSGILEADAIAIANKRVVVDYGTRAPYKVVAFQNGCHWRVIYRSVDKEPRGSTAEYIIEKRTGKVLYNESH